MKTMIKTLVLYALITLLTALAFASCDAQPAPMPAPTVTTTTVTPTTTTAPVTTTTTTTSTTTSTTTTAATTTSATTTTTTTAAPTTTTAAEITTTVAPTTAPTTVKPTTAATTIITTAASTTVKSTTATKAPMTTFRPTTTTTTTTATTTTTKPAATPAAPSAEALRVFELINEERAKAGVAPLEYCYALQPGVDLRAVEISYCFSHTRPDGTKCYTVTEELGLPVHACGENIAWGYLTPEEVMDGWMNSQGHRENILRDWFTGVAVGYDPSTNSWVQMFTF